MATEAERFRLFVSILEPADYEFIRARSAEAEREFRRDRIRIFRNELRTIAADSRKLFGERVSNLAAAGQWNDYPGLAWDSLAIYLAIKKLSLAGALFAWRLPLVIDAARNANRVLAFVTNPKFCPAPQNLPA